MGKPNILVIGDLMLDKYIWGDVNYISPEAPVPVVEANDITYRLGGACNVAANVKTLGGDPILIGVNGFDVTWAKMGCLLEEMGIDPGYVITTDERQTTQKVRIMSKRQQLLRIDFEDTDAVCSGITKLLQEKIDESLAKYNIEYVIVSDYAKGVITYPLLTYLKIKELKLIVDPKPENRLMYNDVWLITPNKEEAVLLAECKSDDTPQDISGLICTKYRTRCLLTLGEKGMYYQQRGLNPRHIYYDTEAQEVFDVTGAGDTVIAALTVALAEGQDISEAMQFANKAAGVAVGKIGTTTVHRREVK